ncbi:MAG: type II pantothenate kinase [Prevotella sp.]|nr:type II pantothenate kinase [Prevotella sp.]
MKTVIGIDVGISTTKIVGIRDGKVISPIRIKATDPVTSLYGAFGKYLHVNNLTLDNVEHVMLTGVGSAYINEPVYSLPTDKTEEFIANGLGACHESGKKRIIVVSMGTGTSLVRCDGDNIEHIGGTGIGGGTLIGLSRLLLNTDDIIMVSEMAKNGDISKINLLISDISAQPLTNLPMDAVASLFGNAQGNVSHEDIAFGLIWMVLQSIGQSAFLASIGSGIREYVMIGNLTLLPQCNIVFPKIENLYDVKLIIPENSEYCTAIGAALCYFDEKYKNTPLH